jgi:hypothetical protein
MSDFGVGGFRLDRVNSIVNWDFVNRYKSAGLGLFRATVLYLASPPSSDLDRKFLVIGEELAVPIHLIRDGCVDALWNETF